MDDCMRDSMRKLAIWNTKTFKPIITHNELEPIMSTLGFIALQPTSTCWKEYVFSSVAATKAFLDHDQKIAATTMTSNNRHATTTPPQPLPRPKLPYPKIDGLHVYSYHAFLDAVNFYLQIGDLSDIFHIRGMPLDRTTDRSKTWRRMEQDETMFVYRDGTLDQLTYNTYNNTKQPPAPNDHDYSNILLRRNNDNSHVSKLVPTGDVITKV